MQWTGMNSYVVRTKLEELLNLWACHITSFLNSSAAPTSSPEGPAAITKPPLLQESRLTGGGSPNLVDLVEWKVPVEGFMEAENCGRSL